MEQFFYAFGTILNGLYLIGGSATAIVFLGMLFIPGYNRDLVEFFAEAKEFYQTELAGVPQPKSMAEVLFFGPYAALGYFSMALPWMMGASPVPGIVLAIVYTIVSYLVYVRYLRTYVK